VDYVVVFEDDTPVELIEGIRPDALVKGADYRREQVVGGDFVEAHGGRVVFVDLVEGRSTTNIIRKISGGAA
jgi:D-beta-D-heptose 7-phosphate kinase / D-beta-D-heptose 1-phosphate adenosyltransferase